MAATYQIVYYRKEPDEYGDCVIARNRVRIGRGVRNRKRAFKLVYWLRRRGVIAFAF